ncbi:MAG: indole-3-glycerol phosphate synthase TrpC [Oscillospiraceae bacterium]|nr:indole-3-glycerol phosphate synthase TrpC [Oscillospiraceae bacterium]
MTVLDKIVEKTKERVERDKKAGLSGLGGALPPAPPRPPFLFEQALRRPGFHFICEVKKASPSKGVIAGDFPYLDIARDYEAAGAAAISVLTEPEFFLGHDRYLSEIRRAVDTPLLRKDFTVDPFQIEQAARLGADAVLLICAILTRARIAEYIKEADRLGLSCLVEVHNEDEADAAVAAGARIIGVNNRNLKTFEVDISLSERLAPKIPREILFVSESGVQTPEDVRRANEAGACAALIGETLMRAPDKKAALAELRSRL